MENLSKALSKKFSFRVHNQDTADRVLAIVPAFYDTEEIAVQVNPDTHATTVIRRLDSPSEIAKAGYTCHAVADDYTGEAIPGSPQEDVKCTPINPAFTIRAFRNFVKTNPLTVKDIIIQQEDGDGMYDQTLRVVHASPIEKKGEDFLSLNEFLSEYQNNTKKVSIRNLNMAIDDTTLLLLPIPAGVKATFTFNF